VAIIVLGIIDIAQNGEVSANGGPAAFPGPIGLQVFFLVLVTAPLYWRKRYPLAVLLFVVGSSMVWILTMFPWSLQPPLEPALAIMAGLFTLASLADGRQLVLGTALAGALLVGAQIFGGVEGQGLGNAFGGILIFSLSWIVGRVVHQHSVHASLEKGRADRLEIEQEEHARRAAERERSRIARELHDVIAHALSMIVVQAAAERRSVGDDQRSTGALLQTIEQTGRQAMVELRRLLGVLRTDGEPPSRSPQPGLRLLPQLASEVREGGLDLEVATEGDLTHIPPGLDLSAYRIVQECLTNVVKHAHARRAEVKVVCRRHSLEIDVSDDGRGIDGSAKAVGFGLIGMRERAALYGGTVEASPAAGGGFRVRAVLPLDASELALS